jgi:uncharacterized membrane protein
MDERHENREVSEKIQSLIDGDRIIGFSDAIFAFAATLLVLKIDLPELPPEVMRTQFWFEMAKLIPAYMANFLSFIIIAYYWRSHHKLFILIKRFDSVLIWLNVLILIFVAFLPFPIDLFGDYSDIPDVVIFYTLSITAVGVMLLVLWLYASHKHRLIDKNMSKREIRYQTLTLLIVPLVLGLSIPIVFYDHVIAKTSWVFILVILFLLDRVYRRGTFRKALGI